MASLFERFMGRKEPSSAEIAKERLKFVLVTDRSNLSPEKLGEMQAEIIGVIKRYLSIEDTDVEIKYEQRDRKNYLVADISLNRDRNYAAFEAPAEAEALAGDALDDVPADMLEDAPGLVAELDESGAGDDDADESAPDDEPGGESGGDPDSDDDDEPDDESGGEPDSEDDDEPD